jgi:hypothetical protein
MDYTEEDYQYMRERLTERDMKNENLYDLFMDGGNIVGWAWYGGKQLVEAYEEVFGIFEFSSLGYDTRSCYVMVGGERIDVKDTEFMDIAEDIQGRDEMTFRYKDKVYKSLVFLK